jgi:hypothetical protein
MKDNRFSNFPFLEDVHDLVELDLSDNEYVTEITPKTFDKVHKLQILNLRNLPKVWSVEKNAFRLDGAREADSDCEWM